MRRPNVVHRLTAPVALVTAAAMLLFAVVGVGPAAAAARRTFRPRIGFAMGLLPRLGSSSQANTGPRVQVVYHGGAVMRNVTVHTIFWAPPGYHFDGPPSSGVPGYEALIKQFLGDVAHDSAGPNNLFSTLTQYQDAAGPGSTKIAYDPATDSLDLNDPYPPGASQCGSPGGIATCITDQQLQQEIDKVIGPGDPGARGLSNLWFVFLPPDVDTCVQPGSCATNAFAGYHSEFDLGHGPTVYVPVPDPLIELTAGPGSDPQGNPDAESSLDTIAHETEEAITDPIGTAWMDPNGFEVADKCEFGPQEGTPLGFAPDGSPYNQVINGHQYLLQDMWSNTAAGCVQGSTDSSSPLPLHTVSLRQFSSSVSGNLPVGSRVPVAVELIRSNTLVAAASATTRSNGNWGPVQLRSSSGAPHAVGDDRDRLVVAYGLSVITPTLDLIETGDGGNPFAEGGYTGWFDLDHGYAVHSHQVVLGPCGQTGVLSLRVGASLTQPPAELCSTESDAAVVPTRRIGPGTPLTMTSQDNRAASALEPDGALVKLTVALGEPGSIAAIGNDQILFNPTGFPTCSAFLRIRAVRCSGLVARARYTLARRHVRAGKGGGVYVPGLSLRGGEAITLTNQAGRRLTTLHVAHLRVGIIGDQTKIASGTCQPGDYYGAPLKRPPIGQSVGLGVGGQGTICPASGRAHGLSVTDIAQSDDFSGGQTVTQVPLIESTAPLNDETLYGPFTASAQSGLPGPAGSIGATGVPVALTITRAASGHRVWHAPNVDTARGVSVPALAPGQYRADWVLRDANGDTRTVTTRFVDEP
jgi:hypothetical protein